MESEKDDAPKLVAREPQPETVMHTSTALILGVLGYILILILAKLANDNRNIAFGIASFGQSPDHILEVDIGEIAPQGSKWEFIGTSGSARVDSYVRKVEGSKLFAFKGVVVIDEPIADVMRTFGSVSTTPEWADMLQIMETLPLQNVTIKTENPKTGMFSQMLHKLKSKKVANPIDIPPDGDNILLNRPYPPTTTSKSNQGSVHTLSDIVYQYYTLPWPIAPREFLFRRDFTVYPTTHSITARYTSTTDERQPLSAHKHLTSTGSTTPGGKVISKHTIRAESPFTNWLFQDLHTHCLSNMNSRDTTTNTNTNGNTDTTGTETTNTPHPGAQATHVCEEVRTALFGTERTYNTAKRRTYIEIESLVDNKGSLPAWLVNYVQRSWASKTLSAMAVSVHKQATHTRDNSDGSSGTDSNADGGVVKFIAAW